LRLINLAYKLHSVEYTWPQNVQCNPQYYQLCRFWVYMYKFLTILKTLFFQCRFLLPPSVSIRKQRKPCQRMLPTYTKRYTVIISNVRCHLLVTFISIY